MVYLCGNLSYFQFVEHTTIQVKLHIFAKQDLLQMVELLILNPFAVFSYYTNIFMYRKLIMNLFADDMSDVLKSGHQFDVFKIFNNSWNVLPFNFAFFSVN